MEPMHTTLWKLADNIIEHIEVEKQKVGAGHAARLDLTEMVKSILVATLHSEGFVRLQKVNE